MNNIHKRLLGLMQDDKTVLTLISAEDNSTVKIIGNGTATVSALYRTDKSQPFTEYTLGETITLNNRSICPI